MIGGICLAGAKMRVLFCGMFRLALSPTPWSFHIRFMRSSVMETYVGVRNNKRNLAANPRGPIAENINRPLRGLMASKPCASNKRLETDSLRRRFAPSPLAAQARR